MVTAGGRDYRGDNSHRSRTSPAAATPHLNSTGNTRAVYMCTGNTRTVYVYR